MRKKVRKGKWKIAGMLSAWILCLCCITAEAGTGAEQPSAELSPDGTGWTIVDELPEEDYSTWEASFWIDRFTEMSVGEKDFVSDELGEGEHIYKYERHGLIPIWKWYVNHEPAECIHPQPSDLNWGGFSIDPSIQICGLNYWSGWIPICANCGEEVVWRLHYIKPSSLQNIDTYDMDMGYYYFCPHNGHMEQGAKERVHMCDAISANQYRVVYKANCMNYKGSMMDSRHMYCNATHYNGVEVVPQTTLNKNNYTRSGYVFKGWSTTPNGEVEFLDQAEIYNLTDENYEDDGTDKGTVYLYAVWERSLSTLIVDADGGYYTDTLGTWDDTTTSRTYANVNYGTKLPLKEESLTPPKGFVVAFDEQGGSVVSDVQSDKKFVSWKVVQPFGGRFQENVYEFIGPDGTVDTIKATYTNGSIELPSTEKEGWTFGGWYLDSSYNQFIGFPGTSYTPSSDVTLYAKWTELVLYAEPKTDAGVAGGKGYAYLKWEQKDDTDKVFRLFRKPAGANASEYVEILSANADGSSFSVDKTFDFTGTTKTYTIPYTGFYDINAYGAQGGNYGSNTGGLGGGVEGSVWLKKGDVLTIVVGGQNGYNGGGSATQYANGGGMTTIKVTSGGNTKTLLIAGGGGGASEMYNGNEGGSSANVIAGSSNGQNGMAGGGAGYQGGAAGAVVYHNHVALGCEKHVHHGNLTSGGDCYLSQQETIECGTWQHRWEYATCSTCYQEILASGGIPNETHHGSGEVYISRETHVGMVGHNWGDFYSAYCTGCPETGYAWNYPQGTKHYRDVITHTLNCDKVWMCGKNETDIETSSGAYGGSSYVAPSITSYDMLSGVNDGNGYVKITATSVGYLSEYAGNDLGANDLAAPDKVNLEDISNFELTADGTNTVLFKWDVNDTLKTKDNGTSYDHLCKSYAPGSAIAACISNMTTVEVKTGVKYYYYVINRTEDTVVTAANKQGYVLASSPSVRIRFNDRNDYCWVHIVAVDQAGNISETAHILLGQNGIDMPLPIHWEVRTRPIYISPVVGGRDRGSVYKNMESGKIYVKADGSTPFNLNYDAYVNGFAEDDYQVDHLYFNVSKSGSTDTQEFLTKFPHTSADTAGTISIDAGSLVRSASGKVLMKDAMNSGVSRGNYAVDASIYQAFSVPSSLHGSSLFITPKAGAEYTAEDGWQEIQHSSPYYDNPNGITIWPDGKAPEISGTSLLESMTDFDRDAGIVLNLSASDADSGLKQFYVKVTNVDNFSSKMYYADADGNLSIPIDNSSALFFGDVSFELVAVDNVGNMGVKTYGALNFGLTASLSKTGVLPRGTGVILDFLTTGYADKVIITWPSEFDPSLPTTFDYTANPEYAKAEAVGFTLPIAGTQSSYDIYVRAYKDGRMLEEKLTIQVNGSILDDVRVRIR